MQWRAGLDIDTVEHVGLVMPQRAGEPPFVERSRLVMRHLPTIWARPRDCSERRGALRLLLILGRRTEDGDATFGLNDVPPAGR